MDSTNRTLVQLDGESPSPEILRRLTREKPPARNSSTLGFNDRKKRVPPSYWQPICMVVIGDMPTTAVALATAVVDVYSDLR